MRKKFVLAVSAMLLAVSLPAGAQPTKKPRIGFLYGVSSSSISARREAFRQGLRKLGYIEGKNIAVAWRYAEGKLDRLPALAAELVRLEVDVIVTSGPSSTRAARNATKEIPIVMARDIDPVRNGFVASLAHPGGNITGLSILAPEISGKQVELLKETLPALSRMAVVGTWTSPGWAQLLNEAQIAAGSFGVELQYLDVRDVSDIETAFRTASNRRADAVLVLGSPVYAADRKQITDAALKNRLPTIFRNSQYVDAGGLMSYGVNLIEMDRRAATYVDKLLKGAKPATLPVEQPTEFELVINLKTAKQIGLRFPETVLYSADRVIR